MFQVFFTPIVWIIVFSCFLLFFTRIIIRNKEKYLSFYDSLSITVASYSIIMVDQIIKFGISINNKKLVLISIGSPSFWFKRVPQVLSSFNLLFILFLIVVAVFLKKYSIKAKRSILSLTIIYLLITFGMGMVS